MTYMSLKKLEFVFQIIYLKHLYKCMYVFFIGKGAGMEDRSEAACDDLQTADCRNHRGENLPQVRQQCSFLMFDHKYFLTHCY